MGRASFEKGVVEVGDDRAGMWWKKDKRKRRRIEEEPVDSIAVER